MPEIANCPLCGKKPVVYPYSYSPWAYECCKIKCDDAETWNRVQAALLAEKELAELKAAVMWERECEELNSIITEKYACMSESAPEEDEISVSHFRAIAAVDELCGGGE